MSLIRQHLIDPEICIRCNTCEEMCPIDAITHNDLNYVVDFDICDGHGDCMGPCPTGAIDSFRMVARAWTVEEQFGWDELPDDQVLDADGGDAIPDDVARITQVASAGQGGRALPPRSAAHPYVNLYTVERPAIAVCTGNFRLTAEDSDVDIRHIVLEFGKTVFPYLEGQSIGILPPGTDANGKPHHVRLYSVASPREGERTGYNNVALTIKRVVEDEDGNPVHGIASNFMCDLERGDEVRVTGPFGATFLMPNDPKAKIVMICTGTGSAPFRAMTERRRRRWDPSAGGELHLYFGARRPSELPYLGPLQKLPADLMKVALAFSRDPDRPKQYVQDRLTEEGDDIARLLRDDDSHIFICGHKRMEDGVNQAFAGICAAHGLDWNDVLTRLRGEGRYHVETYF